MASRVIILLICTLFTITAFAQSDLDAVRILDGQLGFGARALGMGGAYRAVADDYSAIYWNPAGLAQMRKMEFWTDLSLVNFNNDNVYNGVSNSASQNSTKFNSIGLVFPVPTYRGSLVFAFGYQKVKDFEYANDFSAMSNSFNSNTVVNNRLTFDDEMFAYLPVLKSETIYDGGSLNQWSAAGAMDVSPNISLGLTMNFWSGKSDYELEYNQFDQADNFNTYLVNDFMEYIENQIITSKYSSFNFKIGALFRANKHVRIGLGLDLPQTFTVKEEYVNTSSIEFDNGDYTYYDDDGTNSEYDVKTPMRLNGGVSVSAGPALLAGSAEYVDWTQLKFDTDYLRDLNKYFKTDYRSTLKWNVGAEVGIKPIDSQLRAGYSYIPNPIKGLR